MLFVSFLPSVPLVHCDSRFLSSSSLVFFPPRLFKCFSFFLSKCFLTGVLFLPVYLLFLTLVFSLRSHEPYAADLWFGLAADHNLSLGWIFFSFGLFIDNLVCL